MAFSDIRRIARGRVLSRARLFGGLVILLPPRGEGKEVSIVPLLLVSRRIMATRVEGRSTLCLLMEDGISSFWDAFDFDLTYERSRSIVSTYDVYRVGSISNSTITRLLHSEAARFAAYFGWLGAFFRPFSSTPEVGETLPFLVGQISALLLHSLHLPLLASAHCSRLLTFPFAAAKSAENVGCATMKFSQPPAENVGCSTMKFGQPSIVKATTAGQPSSVPAGCSSISVPTKATTDGQSVITTDSVNTTTVAQPTTGSVFAMAVAKPTGKNKYKLQGDEHKLMKFAVDDAILKLDTNNLADVHAKLGHCLVGYIVGKFLGLKAIGALSQSWGANFQLHDNGWLIFRFAREEVSQRILVHGPYFVYRRPLILKNTPAYFEFKGDDVSLVPVWATLLSLPLECWHPNALGKIGSRLGAPIAMDSLTMKMERVSYARILVEVDASKKLVDKVDFILPNGVARTQPIAYEFTPKFCSVCNHFDHLKDSCQGTLPPAAVAATATIATVKTVVPKKVQIS
ncbi:UNVERIFIED_CONTAM: hypothetical protein Slati_0082600 [Sesamum latifolium]|uniref:DUF4283 domain-containing protein n=1 Tax=Sesamum latifolium TaxID=2727402 RepID=A0AAW2Y872_9LAMI